MSESGNVFPRGAHTTEERQGKLAQAIVAGQAAILSFLHGVTPAERLDLSQVQAARGALEALDGLAACCITVPLGTKPEAAPKSPVVLLLHGDGPRGPRARLAGLNVNLTPGAQTRLLWRLAQTPGRCVPLPVLAEFMAPGSQAAPETVYSQMSRLKKNLRAAVGDHVNIDQLIRNIPGMGYALDLSPEEVHLCGDLWGPHYVEC
jgi:hypothetical protein